MSVGGLMQERDIRTLALGDSPDLSESFSR
jgi:hypothetical protein